MKEIKTPVILPDFSKIKILVIGDVMIDEYLFGNIHRISPEAPVPIVSLQTNSQKPGGAANVALNISALGGQVILLGVTGNDEHQTVLETLLDEQRVRHHLLPLAEKTTVKTRVLSQHQQLLRLDSESTAIHPEKAHTQKLLEFCKKYLPECSAVILSDYQKGTLSNPEAFIQLAKQYQCPVFIDPKNKSFSIYQGATILTPNRKEFIEAIGTFASEEELEKKAQNALRQFDLTALLLTRSEEGMTLFEKNKTTHIPAHSHEVFDVTGAGDSVIATLAAAVAGGTSFAEGAVIANIAAGLSTQKLGAAQITARELECYLHSYYKPHSNTVTLNELLPQLELARTQGKKIVFTNGCFDLLHAGHLECLKRAKALGDVLVIGVNSDASVQRLKGKTRPILPLEHRLVMLEALSIVDWVIVFEEDTPENLITAVKPDVLAKGGDYELHSIVGKTFVESYGGKVEAIKHSVSLSTSDIIRTIEAHFKSDGALLQNG